MTNDTYHKSVLVSEVLEYLDPQPGKTYVDVTFGGGGHTRAILDAEPGCNVIAFDWDMKAIEINGPAIEEEYGDRVRLLWGNFANIYQLLRKYKCGKIAGILADFGTSQFQIFEKAGFSVYRDADLDMRMSAAHQKIKASDIVNGMSERDMGRLFYELGGEIQARQIAKAIVERRQRKRFKTTGDLVDLIMATKGGKRKKIHPATKVFQALRIHVNHELENITSFLKGAIKSLDADGRLVCISFHSLEDRLVKQFFVEEKRNCLDKKFKILTTKVVKASEEELQENPSARSACLRAACRS